MAIFRRNGNRLDYTCTADVAPGDAIAVGSIVGVAEAGGVIGNVIALSTCGVFDFDTDGAAITQGAKVYLTDGKATATAGGTYLGIAWSEATASDTTVQVAINMGAAAAASTGA